MTTKAIIGPMDYRYLVELTVVYLNEDDDITESTVEMISNLNLTDLFGLTRTGEIEDYSLLDGVVDTHPKVSSVKVLCDREQDDNDLYRFFVTDITYIQNTSKIKDIANSLKVQLTNMSDGSIEDRQRLFGELTKFFNEE